MNENSPVSEEKNPGALRRFRIPILLLVLASAAFAFIFFPKDDKPKKRSSQISIVDVMPPPPPPSTPPPTPPPTPPLVQEVPQEQPEQEFVEESLTDSAPEPDPAADQPALGSNIQGEGDNKFGLRGKGSLALPGSGLIGSRGSGQSKFGDYARQVQSRVAEALRKNKKVRIATLDLKVRIWLDPSGRITRATLNNSSGDPDLDRTMTDDVLAKITFSQPPPQDMPMPIVMRISARRPN